MRRLHHRGCDLAYEVDGHGPPVILIQGVGVHGSGWRPQVSALSGGYSCLTFDNRGIGRSQPAPDSLTVLQMADDVRALMASQGWESAHIAGHSLGGLIALCFAMESPEKVRSLSLLCTFARGADATKVTPWMLWVGIRSRLGTRAMRRNAFLQFVLPPNQLAGVDKAATAKELADVFGHDLADQPSVAMKQMSAMTRYDATPRLGELSGTPTLVVSARHDRIARPELGRAITNGVPGSRYVLLDDASHGVTIHGAEIINRLLLDHIDSVEARQLDLASRCRRP